MSFELFLICMRDGEEATFKRELVGEIIGPGSTDAENSINDVTYADGRSDVHCIGEGEDISSVCFNHFWGDTFYHRVRELADRTGSFLIWPSPGRNMAITRREILEHIDPELNKEGRPPFVVKNGKDLENAICYEADPDGPTGEDE